ncbi:OVARIAN TUMOR DOMAIN-containing deubiquitinating enzyme 4-like [Tasmannia lanceolata]|uniref:OVARIAN TUMOR DOMAIN-containing deubiquitinating enzyme 4-like n=1 Tax=Tasmannia lanceolata TaxID=3420 RepID=UPI004062E2A0
MITCFPVTTCTKQTICLGESIGKQMLSNVCAATRSPSNSCSLFSYSAKLRKRNVAVTICTRSSIGPQSFENTCLGSVFSKQGTSRHPTKMRSFVSSTEHQTCLGLSLRCRDMSLRLLVPKHERVSNISWNVRTTNRLQRSSLGGLIFGVCVCLLSSEPVYAEAAMAENDKEDEYDSSSVGSLHGKRVYNDYSITGIPGDGRCLFRSVVHGACLRSGKPSSNEGLQRELADELRSKVADEFVKRREETEWFIEGDFDTYVSQIRKPHVWGGEPELLMASHVLQMPITVYLHDDNSGGLITIAEYGQEYGKENPIRVLYHGFGHYDALQIPGNKGGKSRL